VAPVPVTQLILGVPYVMVCTDQSGHQTASIFVYGVGNI
jgi:hypothetical protein